MDLPSCSWELWWNSVEKENRNSMLEGLRSHLTRSIASYYLELSVKNRNIKYIVPPHFWTYRRGVSFLRTLNPRDFVCGKLYKTKPQCFVYDHVLYLAWKSCKLGFVKQKDQGCFVYDYWCCTYRSVVLFTEVQRDLSKSIKWTFKSSI